MELRASNEVGSTERATPFDGLLIGMSIALAAGLAEFPDDRVERATQQDIHAAVASFMGALREYLGKPETIAELQERTGAALTAEFEKRRQLRKEVN